MIIQSSTAQREWEEIAQIHRNPAGPNSARNITSLILDTLARLETFLLSGHIPMIRKCETVYVYHIAHGAGNYPGLFKKTSESRTSMIQPGNVFPIWRDVFFQLFTD